MLLHNTSSRTPGKGSAILLHVWRRSNSSTAGRTAASEDNMIKLLQWIDPSKNPVIFQGTE